MKKNNSFGKYRDYFLVGIGGAGMSAIALVLKGMGSSVRGSDMKDSRYTALLRKEGIEVSIGHALVCDALYFGLENAVRMYLRELRID